MAEDESVDVLPMNNMNTELAERLGVLSTGDASPKQRRRARSGRANDPDEFSNSSCSVGSTCRSAHHNRGDRVYKIIPELDPFRHLLPPEITFCDPQGQAIIYRLVFDAGLKAYHHLLQYVLAVGSGSSSSSVSSISTIRMFDHPADNRESPVSDTTSDIPLISRLQSIDSETENLTMIDRIDHAYETMIEVGGDIGPLNLSGGPEMNPQMLANTLGLFAGAALRRPPTRAVECVMAAAQDTNGAHSEVDRHDMFDTQASSVDPYSPCEDGLLVLACAAGFTDLVEAILKLRQATMFASEGMDVTPLMEACAAGTAAVVDCLIKMHADVNAMASTNNTALIYAAAASQVECVRLLLATEECDVNVKNENGHCALMEAASSGNVEIVKMLIECGAIPTFTNMHSEFKESPLTLAAYKGHLDVTSYLLSIPEANEDVEYSEEELHTALMEASMDGHVEVARALLQAGAPVNMTSDAFESPLTLACCGGHDILVKMLLDAGAYIEEPNDEGYTPLMEAAREGHTNVVKILLEHGAQVNAQTEETGETAMTVAACGGYTDVLEELVRNGGDLELGGNTPLMEAAQEGHAQTVLYIVSAASIPGRSPNFRSHATTSLCLAAENGHQDVVEILFTSGAELNAEVDGRTPLMKAAKNGYTEIVTFLITKNVDVNRKSTNNDATALSLACAAGHKDIVSILLLAGADPNVELKDGVSCVLEAARSGFVEIVELMLDHSGIVPNYPTSLAAASAKAVASSTGISGHPKAVATRRKKPSNQKGYNGVPPDPSINGPPLYSSQFPISNQIPSSANIYSSIDDARDYYRFLANIYNVRCTKNLTMPPVSDLPANLSHSDILNEVDKLQKMITSMPHNAELLRAEILSNTRSETAKRMEAMMKARGSLSCNVPPVSATLFPHASQNGSSVSAPPPSPATEPLIPSNNPKYLSSVYEHGKKNFSGLPMPMYMGPTVPSCAATSPMSTIMSAFASPNFSNMTMEQVNELMTTWAQLAQNSSDDGQLTAEQLQTYAAGLEALFSSISDKKMLKKRMHEFKEYVDGWELKKKGAELRASSIEYATKEQQTTALSEAMKVLRPTVTSLPGGVVSSGNGSSPAPSVNYGGGAHATHRRTHSEGDESDLRAQMASGKGSFNVDKATESNNDTPLTLACSNGHKDMVSVLVSRGANIEHRDKKGFTPLILAATGGHVGVVEALLNAGANIEAQSERTKDTALSLACSGGRKEVVELLLSKGANKEHRNVSDYTPLSLAASGGYVDIVNMLLNAGAEINSRTGSKLGISPLMLAAMNGHKDATRVLLEKGSDINAQIETNRNTALTLACFQGRTDVVRLLLQYNANVEHRAKTGLTPLMEAANGGYVEVGELLLEYLADPNTTPVPSSRDTALTIAADKGHDKFVEMLLLKGAIIDARNKKGCTALWLACHGGHLDTVQVLVRHKADVDAQDNRKVSPLMIAFRKGFLRIVSYLVHHVKQYPNDQEMDRYMSTLATTDAGKTTKEIQDLTKNCTESMNVIKKAKTAQAEQANKAAESLLALLAEEEEQAKTKKQKKAKKREEKKAKKAKKGDEKAKSQEPVDDSLMSANPDSMKEDHHSEESEDESECHNTVEEPPVVADIRVPQVIEVPPHQENVDPVAIKQKKSSNRRSRAETAKGVPNGSNLSTLSSPKATTTLAPTSPGVASKISPQPEEWVKASKKKSQSKARSATVQSSPPKDFFSDESGAFGGWKDVELSRRRSNTLTVCSTVIARVIGRGGANINAIREATGASIEVEKQSTRRDQHERQICIRGTSETVRNATLMINGLITDNEVTVNDVIRQVLRGNTSVASSSSESGSRSVPAVDIKIPATPMATGTTAKSSAAPTPATTTNVWQQRMAARQQQLAAKEPVPVVPEPTTRITSSVKIEEASSVQAAQPHSLAPFSSEEELRKAPGYRPQNVQASQVNEVITPPPTVTNTVDNTPSESKPIETAPLHDKVQEVIPYSASPVSVVEDKNSSIKLPVKELGNLSVLEKSEIAKIWNGDGRDSSSNEPAWGSQLLLTNSFPGLSLSSQDWSSALPSSDFSSSLATTSSTGPRVTTTSSLSSTSTSYDWMTPGSAISSSPLYSRPPAIPRSVATTSVSSRQENNALFNQLAAQLLNQGTGAASSVQPPSNYYPPNTFADSSSTSISQAAAASAAQKSYAQVYQSANQEYENLNNILSSYNASHYASSSGDYNPPSGYPSSPSTVRSIPSRLPSNYAPPPGFSSIAPSVPPLNANTAVPPPPHLRQFFAGQLPPLSQSNSAFSLYSQQQGNNWSKLNGSAPGGGSSWNGGWN